MGYSTTTTGIYCDRRECGERLELSLDLLTCSHFHDRAQIDAKAKALGWSCWTGAGPRGRRREFCPRHGPAGTDVARRIW